MPEEKDSQASGSIYRDLSTENQVMEAADFGDRPSRFPEKLYFTLKDLEQDGLDWIAGWCIHGRAFRVRDQSEFASRVLPLYFQIKKYTSFQRQLNLYGFQRITKGDDRGCYYHESFLRTKPHLCARLERIKIKGTGPRKPADPSTEPDLYSFPYLPMLPGDERSSDRPRPSEPKSNEFVATQRALPSLTSHASGSMAASLLPNFPVGASQLPDPIHSTFSGASIGQLPNLRPPAQVSSSSGHSTAPFQAQATRAPDADHLAALILWHQHQQRMLSLTPRSSPPRPRPP